MRDRLGQLAMLTTCAFSLQQADVWVEHSTFSSRDGNVEARDTGLHRELTEGGQVYPTTQYEET